MLLHALYCLINHVICNCGYISSPPFNTCIAQFVDIRICTCYLLGEYSLPPLALLLQCLPKEPGKVEDGSYVASAPKWKKLEASVPYSDNNASMQLMKLTIENLEKISQALSKSTCKEIFLVVQSLLKNTAILYSHKEVQGFYEYLITLHAMSAHV